MVSTLLSGSTNSAYMYGSTQRQGVEPPGSGVLQPTLLATKQLAMSACGYISFGTSPGSDVQYLRVPPVFTGVVPPNANIHGDLGTNYQPVVTDPWLTYFNGSIYAPCPYVYQMVLVGAQSLVITLPPIGPHL